MNKHILFADSAAETRTAQMRWEAFCAVMSSWGEANWANRHSAERRADVIRVAMDYAHEAVAAWGVSRG